MVSATPRREPGSLDAGSDGRQIDVMAGGPDGERALRVFLVRGS